MFDTTFGNCNVSHSVENGTGEQQRHVSRHVTGDGTKEEGRETMGVEIEVG